MTLLTLATPVVSNDEPAFMLIEEHINLNSKGWRRYQIITVVRNDELVEWHHDMGPSKNFEGIDMFRIPGGVMDGKKIYIEHTVGELRDIADQLRSRPQMRSQLPRTDLVKAYQEYLNKLEEAQKNRMIFGYTKSTATRKENYASNQSN